MPDKWEYPWYATWDLAFHMIPLAKLDPDFAKQQLILFLREWYMHPNGAIPTYEFGFSDTTPPLHAWACWRVYKLSAPKGKRDRIFLARVFHKLLLNFTWWVNRKDGSGKNLFEGGFLGMDNIGLFDRSQPLPVDGRLEQADATGPMAFYCGTMLSMALELAAADPAYEDVASKFFEHFTTIADAINTFGGTGLWDEALERYHYFYGDDFKIECPTGSGQLMNLASIAQELSARLYRIFRPDDAGRCPWQGETLLYASDPYWRDLTLFHEHFDGDTGRGLGANHQTGWTALIARLAFGNRIGIRLSSSY